MLTMHLPYSTTIVHTNNSNIYHLPFIINVIRLAMEKNIPLIEIKNLSRWYADNPDPLFKDLNLSLKNGDFFVLTGHSGTGKSTLAKFITGGLTPPADMIFYNQQDMSTFTTDDIQIIKKRMGIVFQEYQLIDDLSVRENIK